MAVSVGAALRSGAVEQAGLVERAVTLAMEPRITTLIDDHHPAYLHPGRSVLVLLRDIGTVPAATLAAAAVLESEDDALRVPDPGVSAELGDPIGAWVAAAPRPGHEGLVERLLELPTEAALAVLAERLDHLRHLHMRPDLEPVWRDRHEEVTGAWQPFAARTHELLGRRYAHWARTFGRRLVRG